MLKMERTQKFEACQQSKLIIFREWKSRRSFLHPPLALKKWVQNNLMLIKSRIEMQNCISIERFEIDVESRKNYQINSQILLYVYIVFKSSFYLTVTFEKSNFTYWSPNNLHLPAISTLEPGDKPWVKLAEKGTGFIQKSLDQSIILGVINLRFT